MIRREFRAMGSRMLAVIDSDTPTAARAAEAVPTWFEEWETALSRFRPESELNRLNGRAGQAVQVSRTLYEVFLAARAAEAFTGGLVRPTMLEAIVRAGYDRSFDRLDEDGEMAPQILLAAPASSWQIECDDDEQRIVLPRGVQLDFGGVAKGWAAREAARRLDSVGAALVDAGGDIAVSRPPGEGAWPIGIRDPFHPELDFEKLQIRFEGVATSGTDYHRWRRGARWNHHLIDPATGLPAETDVLTATVVARDVTQAEAAAKYVVIAGSAAGMEWLEADPQLAGVVVTQSGEALYSRGMQSFVWRSE
jgi:FAD:protein FMN transferase